MSSERIIDCFCTYYSCCYEAHVLRLEHGPNRFSVREYLSAKKKAERVKRELKNQDKALSALALEAKAEAEKDFHGTR